MALKLLDNDVPDLATVERQLGDAPAQGYSLAELAHAAEELGAHVLAVQTTIDRLTHRPGRFACIAHIDEQHFVLLHDVSNGGLVEVLDPPDSFVIPTATLGHRWSGKALLIANEPLIPEESIRIPRSAMWTWSVLGLITAWVALCVWRKFRGAT